MKKKMVIILFLSFVFLLSANIDQEEIQGRFDQGKEQMLSRLDYGTSYAFLPMNLAMAMGSMIYFPLEYEVFEWDPDLEEWGGAYNYYFTYTDGYLTQYIIQMNMQGALYVLTIDLTWEDGFLVESTNTTVYNEVLMMTRLEHYFYTDDELFESYLLQDWDAENEIWLDAEQWNSTIVDGRITVMNIDEWDEDMMNWRPDERLTYTWDGDIITSQLEEYYDDQVWTNSDLHYMYYLPSGQMDYILYQIWNGAWVNDVKETYTYEDDMHTYSLTERWENEAWGNFEQETLGYDDQERPSTSLKQRFEEETWVNNVLFNMYYVLDNDTNEITQQTIEMSAYPNPFNPTTTLNWQIAGSAAPETLDIYDLRGRIVNQMKVVTSSDGKGSITWNGSNADGTTLPSGIYFYRLEGVEKAAKILLLK
ncbi:MAG: T9SS type A sorting domain-containing protein [Candidatus Cloacimonetes bacterium]|nr:T9SS type A sorting domain-containing protein [Candidatus Cloacimonadota bacterium]